jgi:glycosyltransferase involved in cell wall biosynthesis
LRPDLVHAITPRDHVRELTLGLRTPYVVHLEDNEPALGRRLADPAAAARFLDGAAGVTVVVDRLLEHKPAHVPGAVVQPGFDEAVLSPSRPREQIRAGLGLRPEELALVYTGNVHEWNVREMRSLYLAVALLRRDGAPVVLVKTGWNSVPRAALVELGPGLRDLGWVSRKLVPDLLAAADVLVQPGRPGPWNDYRFPSKLPDFLASGRPVVLPRSNVGLALRHGEEALVMERGDATEIYESVERLAGDAELRAQMGRAGQSFALRELRWPLTIDAVERLYDSVVTVS